MQFEYKYKGSTSVENGAHKTSMSFSPDTSREPTYFRGLLAKHVPFREAISALHDVVVSDLRFKPKDKTDYKEWAKRQYDDLDWAKVMHQRQNIATRMTAAQNELNQLYKQSTTRMQSYYTAQRRFFEYLYQKDRDMWFVLDPVITVHPDELFFECFSQDESSYGRLSANLDVFKDVGDFACGTTNIDYSAALYDEFQKIRSYKETQFTVDPSGFGVQTQGEDDYKEVKIDLPDTWVRGFLQVNSAMGLPAKRVTLHPMDIHNFCFMLRRKHEKIGPRSLRFILTPNEPVKVIFDPWNIELVCSRSIYEGSSKEEIRVWGRRRLLILERLIPIAKKFTLHLLGQGMPYFFVADLGDMSFTLGLSGWTQNNWSDAGNFDLLAPRLDVDEFTKRRIYAALRTDWRMTPDALAQKLELPRAIILSALSSYSQAGSAMFDLNKDVYRARELSREPLPVGALRFSNEREQVAAQLLQANAVTVASPRTDNVDGQLVTVVSGAVRQQGRNHTPKLWLDSDMRVVRAECTCNFYLDNKLHKGPCDHMIATRIQYSRRFLAV